MKAIVKTAAEPGALEWGEWPEPEPRPGHVIVEIERAGICSTDVAIYDWTYRGRQPVAVPSMLGHEAAGTVAERADDVTELEVGARVALQVIWGHAQARQSLKGFENLDPDWFHIGASRLGGVFAERIAVPADRVVLVPDGVGWDDAALIEPLAVAANAMELVNLRPAETFALVGPGPFGLLMCRIARASGAARVIAVGLEGVDEARLEVARLAGADATLTFSDDTEQVAGAVRELTGADGADVVIDAVGTPQTWKQAFYARDLAGTVVLVGVPTPEMKLEIPLLDVFGRGGALKSSWYGDCLPSRDFPMLIDLYLQGRLDLEAFVTETIPLDGVEEAFARMHKGDVLRSVVVF
jgi:S-(hydroxymethyl)mycothiol dehydrogenase